MRTKRACGEAWTNMQQQTREADATKTDAVRAFAMGTCTKA
jgi:hypothetical protein